MTYILDKGFWWPENDVHCRMVVLNEVEKLVDVTKLCSEKRAAVQAGGNVGVFPRELAKTFERVYTFEPDQDNFRCLNMNVAALNVFKFPAALACEHRCVDLSRESDNIGAHYVNGSGPIPTLTIDDLALDACDLIYLDIEGAEWLALIGATQTIRKHRPVIVFEDKGLSERFGSEKGHIEREMTRLYGYSVHSRPERDVVMVP